MTRLERALDSIWISGLITDQVIEEREINLIRDHLKRKNILFYISNDEIKCIWKSYVDGRFPDKEARIGFRGKLL